MSETYTPDNLIAGDYPLVTGEAVIESGQNLSRGALLGKVTATDKFKLCDSAAADGSENPQGTLAEDIDASAADQVSTYYLAGEFNEAAIIFGGSDDADTHRAVLRDLNIYLKAAVSA